VSETQRIILENHPIRKKYLTTLSKPCRYGLQSPRSPVGLCKICDALVAQMDRVLASEAKGRGFDSRRARHFFSISNTSFEHYEKPFS
jgi:hypothetical protein